MDVAPQPDDHELIRAGDPLADVVHVEVVGPLTLFVRFDDGVAGRVQFLPSHLTGVFELLRDPHYFAQVRVAHGAVSWPIETPDLAPDAMHAAIARDGEWTLD